MREQPKSLATLARDAVASDEFKQFGDALATQPLPQSFGVLTDADLVSTLKEHTLEGNPADWATRPLTWNAELYDPQAHLGPADKLLHLLWQDLNTRLSRKLDAVGRRATIARQGAVLCFFGRAEFSILVEYTRSGGGAVDLRPLAALSQPNGVLELNSLLDEATPEIGNAIKNAALSVDKLVYQRGSVVHVDRQRDDVFGPTIDTVILGELAAEWLDGVDRGRTVSALEIGPGSGLLSAVLASSDCVRDLTAVDLNWAAVNCTLKNLLINDVTLDAKHQQIRVRAERFEADQFASSFDFVICNPPYIPEPPDGGAPSMVEYGRAVGGLDLCVHLLENLPTLLSDQGVLLLMTSSLSHDEVCAAVPEGFEFVAALGQGGRRVPLDVDTVWRQPEWRDQLLNEDRIEQDADGRLWHQLRPVWIKRRATTS